ncbi:MAG TPA: DUF3243 domain-containing protein [Limnochordia bacterium]|nr:DUF3243 domain-containing protein [Limnochordia bacterium]
MGVADERNVSDGQNWNEWKSSLSNAVAMGKRVGMSEGSLKENADRIGDYLAQRVDPRNPQQSVLKELWEVGSDEEQEALASMLVKLVGR